MSLPQADDRIRLLHISDLHFVGKLTETGSWLRTRAPGTKSHDFGKLEALCSILETGVGRNQAGRYFDHLIVTGDVSTDGGQASLQTALRFLEEDMIFRQPANRLLIFGLSAGKAQRTVVPGNHDRYSLLSFQGRQRNFETTFGSHAYPQVSIIQSAGGGRPDLILFEFDSTQTLGRINRLWRPWERIARGEVGRAECEALLRWSRDICTSKEYEGVGVDLSNCVRLAILHHHPVLPGSDHPCHGRGGYLKDMDNHEEFVQRCLESGINLVLFGHQHCAYPVTVDAPVGLTSPFGAGASAHFLCCATTSEYSAKKPGFYLYDIGSRDADVYEFSWVDQGFSRSPRAMRLSFV